MINLPTIKEIVQQFGLLKDKHHSKKLGQNFLFDSSLMEKIVRHAGDFTNCDVVEIGPGPGGLTRTLLETNAHHIFAIEKDPSCVKALELLKQHYPERFTIIENDALKVKLSALTSRPIKIVANLPYNVGTALLVTWLQMPHLFKSFTLMFQREVAYRIIAPVDSEHYGRLSVLAQYVCDTDRLFDVPPQAFTPAPKVFSSIVQLIPKALTVSDMALLPYLETITKAAFGQRRKMLRVSLKALSLPEAVLFALLEKVGINPTQRAETVTVETFARLAQELRSQHI